MYNPNGMITTKMFYMFSKMFFEVAQWMIHADTATVTLLSIWAAAKFARVEASGLSRKVP